MKKNLISWMVFTMAAIVSVGLVSCGDDDDDMHIPPSPVEEETDFTIELSTSRQAIDLGLPSGTLWANMNIGANSNASPGGYYMWGETHEITHDYSLYDTGSGYKYLGRDISGTIYDAAYVLWGEDWKMPSIEQFLELCQNCEYTKSYLSGIEGYVFVGANGNRIFLPCGGEIDNRTLSLTTWNNDNPYYASYWSSSANLEPNMESQAWSWTPRYSNKWNNSRLSGCNIRPVRNK